MDRRSLFGGFKNFGSLARQAVEETRAQRTAIFRPPGAIPEDDFINKCTRCNDCIDACEPAVLYKNFMPDSPLNLTPTLDPNSGPCELCDGVPCASACTTGALLPIEKTEIKIGVVRIYIDHCISWLDAECTMCQDECPVENVLVTDSQGRMRVREANCTGCGDCVNACPLRTSAIEVVPMTREREAPAV